MAVGDYVQRRDHLHGRTGNPVAPRTKAHILMATRTFFRDCQEREWFRRRFDPTRALALRRSVGALIGTDPRVIADDVWAKLLRVLLADSTGPHPSSVPYTAPQDHPGRAVSGKVTSSRQFFCHEICGALDAASAGQAARSYLRGLSARSGAISGVFQRNPEYRRCSRRSCIGQGAKAEWCRNRS